jgi:hypothetical protein
VYVLGFDDLRKGAGFRAAKFVGWRRLVDHQDGRKVAGEVSLRRARPAFSHFTEGALVEATEDTLHWVESQVSNQAADYRVRLLRVPALQLQALWLVGKDDAVFAPIRPDARGEHRFFGAADFLEELRRRVKSLSVKRESRSSGRSRTRSRFAKAPPADDSGPPRRRK